MKKVFVSTGFKNRSEQEVREDFNRAFNKCQAMQDEPIEIVHNYDCIAPEGAGPGYCIGEAIKKLRECDTCYFCAGYKNYRGCLAEEAICDVYGINKIYEEKNKKHFEKIVNKVTENGVKLAIAVALLRFI